MKGSSEFRAPRVGSAADAARSYLSDRSSSDSTIKNRPLPPVPAGPAQDHFEASEASANDLVRTRVVQFAEPFSQNLSSAGASKAAQFEEDLKSLTPAQARAWLDRLLDDPKYSIPALARRDDLEELSMALQNVYDFHKRGTNVSDFLLRIGQAKNQQESTRVRANGEAAIRYLSADKPNFRRVVRLCEEGADLKGVNKEILNRRDIRGNTLLHYAADSGSQNALEVLLAAGADPRLANQYGKTPLHFAAKVGHPEIARALLKYGADPFAALAGRSRSPITALALASDPDTREVISEAMQASMAYRRPIDKR